MRAHIARHARQALVRRLATTAWPPLGAFPHQSMPTHAKTCPRRLTNRTFLTSLLQKPPRDVRDSEYEPGWMDIMIWRSRVLDNLKPQPVEKLRRAWSQFMKFKLATQRPLNTTQATQCRRLLEYLCPPDGQDEQGLDKDGILLAIKALAMPRLQSRRPAEFSGPEHLELAYALIRALRIDLLREIPVSPATFHSLLMLATLGELKAGLKMCPLSKLHNPRIALIAQRVFDSDSEEDLKALTNWDDQTGAKSPGVHKAAVKFYAKHDRVEETLEWFEKAMAIDAGKDDRFFLDLLESVGPFAARNGREGWLRERIRGHTNGEFTEQYWLAIVCGHLWLGDGLSAVEGVISKMLSQQRQTKPDIRVFNAMLSVAMQKGDEQLGNEITSMAAERGVAPDLATFSHWMGLKVKAGNFEGAKFALNRLRTMSPDDVAEPGSKLRVNHEDNLNEFLGLACAQKTPDFPYISEVLDHVDEIQARLEPETVAQLSLRFLENEQFIDVMDLLAINTFKYGESERQVVQAAFVSFCLDSKISTSRAWSSYQVLEQYFPDLERPARVQLMNEFFRRKRADMAIKVFGAMRNHRSPAYRPDEWMYRQCFEGLARNPDLESIQQAHNWLKTDASTEPSTRLFTALMLAYTASGRSLTALDFWNEITASREGPGYSSLAAAFWALENRPNGAKMAREIWDRLENMDVDIPADVYNSYVGAIAGSGHVVEAQKIILNMASYVGEEPNAMTLGIAFNALPGRELQKEFEEWAKLKYRGKWAELEKLGRRLNELQLCQFKLQRPLEAY